MMSKKNKSQSVILILVFLSFAIALGAYFDIIPLSLFGSDFTVTSISTSQIISNDQDVEGAWFLINTVLGGGQHITGEIDPAEFKRQSGYETQKTFTLKADVLGETLDYTIRNDARGIYSYVATHRDTCPAGTTYKILLHDTSWLFPMPDSYVCVTKVRNAVKGSFNNPSVGFDADLTLLVGSDVIKKSISNHDSSVSFMKSGETLATGQWQGSLVSGDPVPNQDLYVPYFYAEYFGSPDTWRVAKASNYDEWMASETVTDSQLQQYQQHPHDLSCDNQQHGLEIVNNLINEPNWRADKILNSDYKISDTFEKVNPTSANSGAIRVYLNRRINNPQILFKVRAKWVQVVIPVSKAIITDASCSEFTSGQQGIIKATIKNVGNSPMTASTSFSGCSPFEMAYSAPTTPLDAGQTKTVLLHISHGSSNQDLIKTCTVRVQDYNQPANYDTEPVTVRMSTAYTCIPNEYTIKGGTCIWRCNSAGTADVEVVCCPNGVGFEEGRAGSYDGWYCKGDPNLDCETDIDCNDNNPDTIDKCKPKLFGLLGKECRHYNIGSCLEDSECDDDVLWTKDSCVGSIKLINQRGTCRNTPDYILIFGGLLVSAIALMLVINAAKGK